MRGPGERQKAADCGTLQGRFHRVGKPETCNRNGWEADLPLSSPGALIQAHAMAQETRATAARSLHDKRS
ncbi:hypothetical protein GOFOIKOB_2963 [Methylobacterium tardum]|uniref:Uncharacterized protein n=1 Tax=Methylobacterium tardum TaxID=374432 RepID=A0AA37TH81_9HYPH|nr:hypothetical protein GOFOIKOB_2963 [Methylobacterium tardum]GLS70127.1 hypothetical protein GCM10007890_21400 [Methylobacterium tardum]